ncbi:MAG TPA: DUF5319 family protein [Actinomycetota bacterium]
MPDDDPIDEPSDPEDAEPPKPLEPQERENVEADLEDLSSMRSVFEAQGAKGVVINCTDCGENHFYGWELLHDSLEHMLKTGEPRMHEPAYAPKEDDYVVWDYGKGYVDALADAGLDPEARFDVRFCPWCKAPCDSSFAYCPACGRALAPARLFAELLERGMPEKQIRALLVRVGFEPFG